MTLNFDGTLVLVGAGKMGMALLDGIVQGGVAPSQIVVQDPAPQPDTLQKLNDLGIRCIEHAHQLADVQPDLVLLAVKPQVFNDVSSTLTAMVAQNCLVLSVMAGIPLARLNASFATKTPVVRAMPNTPAAIGCGMTVCTANSHVDERQRQLADSIFAATGDVAWIDDERHMDSVTAVSGSGPAYVFLLAEAMTAAGIEAGLEETLAARLARTTIAGAGQLLKTSEQSAEDLRKAVTSPGGTTAAALQVLMENKALQALLVEAVQAAKKRSEDLAK